MKVQSNHAVSSERQNSELTNGLSKYANCIDANKYNELYGDFTSCYIHISQINRWTWRISRQKKVDICYELLL